MRLSFTVCVPLLMAWVLLAGFLLDFTLVKESVTSLFQKNALDTSLAMQESHDTDVPPAVSSLREIISNVSVVSNVSVNVFTDGNVSANVSSDANASVTNVAVTNVSVNVSTDTFGAMPASGKTMEPLERHHGIVTNGNSTNGSLGAFVYLVYGLKDEKLKELEKSIVALDSQFLSDHPQYPIVLFVENASRFSEITKKFAPIAFEVVVVDPKDWAVNIPNGTYPELWRPPRAPITYGFSVSYRQMSRYAAGFLLGHPALAKFEYVIKLDPDAFATGNWTADPFERMRTKKKKIGYYVSICMHGMTEQMPERFNAFLQEKHLELKQPNLAFKGGRFRHLLFYGFFVAVQTSFFRSALHREFFEFMDVPGGFFKYRWDEQYFYVLFAGLDASADEIEFMDYVSVVHQGSKSPRKISC
jgi:hypothetical protein